VVLPGQDWTRGGSGLSPDLDPGFTGSPTPQTAGVPFTVHVYAVDEYWNVVEGSTPVIHLSAGSTA
jgi:hypothetical protein